MNLYHLGVSGGKDSTALLLWAIHESGLPRDQLRVTFCDTGNEDPVTYAHITLLDQIAREAGIPGGVETIMPSLAFFALAHKKGRFPSRKAQFCTIELKIKPTKKWLADRWAEGHEVVIINGKRLGESAQRRKSMKDQPERGFSDFWGCEEWAPLRHKTLRDVLALHERHGVPLNPLYALGAKRVGCFPCMNCDKTEIRIVAYHRPEKIDQIESEEEAIEIEGGKPATFFGPRTATMPYRTKQIIRKRDGAVIMVAPIRKVVEWSHTERGGKQIRLPLEETKACFLNTLACE